MIVWLWAAWHTSFMQSYFIWGMGLLGTSLALDLKARGFHVAGVSSSEQDIEILNRLGFRDIFLLHKNHNAAAGIISRSQGVIIATPAKAVVQVLSLLKSMSLPNQLWITDVSSAKKQVMQEIEKEEGFINFVGSHPMAGSDLSGPQNAYPNMFVQASVFITPQVISTAWHEYRQLYQESIQRVKDFWRMLGGQPFEVSYSVHDRWAAYLSHGLHLVSCMIPILMNDIPQIFSMPHGAAGGSFRDISRVSGSNPELWKNIIEANRSEVMNYLKRLSELSMQWHNALGDDSLPIGEIFSQAAEIRKKLVPQLPPEPTLDKKGILQNDILTK